MKKLISLFTTLIIVSIILIFSIVNGHLRFNYPDVETYPIQGMDISHHQNKINWSKIDASEIQFVFIKATEGGDYKDPKFLENWTSSKNKGLKYGAYHFFTFCKSGIEQANNFIESVPIDSASLPPVIDLEYGGNCTLTKSKEEILTELSLLEEKLMNHYHKKPILYVTHEFYDDFLLNQFMNNPLWIRDIYRKPTLSNNRKWVFWQYANRGHLAGIDTYVDLNVFKGTKEEFEKINQRSK